MTVLAIPDVLEYLNNLVIILYEKEYFSYEEEAQKYVDDLADDIFDNLPKKLHRPAPNYYNKYGKNLFYACFTKNACTERREVTTTWYAFFSKYKENEETIYLIRYIGNNHTDAHHLL